MVDAFKTIQSEFGSGHAHRQVLEVVDASPVVDDLEHFAGQWLLMGEPHHVVVTVQETIELFRNVDKFGLEAFLIAGAILAVEILNERVDLFKGTHGFAEQWGWMGLIFVLNMKLVF